MGIIKLTQNDWEELLPSVAVTLGKTIVEIKPLGVEHLKSMVLKISTVYQAMVERGITLDSMDTTEGMAAIFDTVVDYSPKLLEEATGIDANDIIKLPFAKGVELLRAVLEVNLSSYQDLLKNFKALGEIVKGTTAVGE